MRRCLFGGGGGGGISACLFSWLCHLVSPVTSRRVMRLWGFCFVCFRPSVCFYLECLVLFLHLFPSFLVSFPLLSPAWLMFYCCTPLLVRPASCLCRHRLDTGPLAGRSRSVRLPTTSTDGNGYPCSCLCPSYTHSTFIPILLAHYYPNSPSFPDLSSLSLSSLLLHLLDTLLLRHVCVCLRVSLLLVGIKTPETR